MAITGLTLTELKEYEKSYDYKEYRITPVYPDTYWVEYRFNYGTKTWSIASTFYSKQTAEKAIVNLIKKDCLIFKFSKKKKQFEKENKSYRYP